ncbi:MAG TPA: hypothetical protein VM582_05000, partial [Candidatus Thermoplasmatota archaeon]|nr:hypothetical protein [Candidatus Thermoplasmatota archaeon]
MAAKLWKKGRDKLGVLDPLLGSWIAEAGGPQGAARCARAFERDLGGKYVRLRARWTFAKREPYEELALFGRGDGGAVAFWSFTSDGKRSQGALADATDVHPEAVGFEARMDAGLARMVYWPDGAD